MLLFHVWVFLGYIPRSEIVMWITLYNLLRDFVLFPRVAELFIFLPADRVWGFRFLLILTNTCYYHFEYGHSSLLKWSDISSLHLVLSGEKHLWCGAVVGVNRKKVFETLSSSFGRPLNIFVLVIEYSCGSRLRI